MNPLKYLLPAIAAAAVTVAVIATTSGASSPARSASTRILRLVEHDAAFTFIDVPPKNGETKPPTEGDEFVIGGRLTEGQRTVGTSNLTCTVTQPGKAAVETCAGTLVVTGGTIAAQGIARVDTNSDTFAVTGGTGAFTSAHGTVASAQGSDGNDHLTVRLAP